MLKAFVICVIVILLVGESQCWRMRRRSRSTRSSAKTNAPPRDSRVTRAPSEDSQKECKMGIFCTNLWFDFDWKDGNETEYDAGSFFSGTGCLIAGLLPLVIAMATSARYLFK
ncbi:uncharacterized protein LOC128239452 isoform X1 [Mya arenaria]|uniref:uncharacterized protein LOC128239452 isoform X1 n=1 Tax=Mya arenaria TaxID=6604 RepID=UPI0022E812FC|nr:uncharacterized protein LOC128239452 isoform X1 [Mya arenaria]